MQNAQPGNGSRLGIDTLFAKLLRSEIVSSKQLNSVLTHRAKLYSPQLPAGNLAGNKTPTTDVVCVPRAHCFIVEVKLISVHTRTGYARKSMDSPPD